MQLKILFVCTGNICRSPVAEAILRHMCNERRLPWTVDSAAIGGWHIGDLPDNRAQQTASERGYDMSGIRSRAICAEDFVQQTHIYAMSDEHRRFLLAQSLPESTAAIRMFLPNNANVPDPYYGGAAGFSHMVDLLEDGCRAIIQSLAD